MHPSSNLFLSLLPPSPSLHPFLPISVQLSLLFFLSLFPFVSIPPSLPVSLYFFLSLFLPLSLLFLSLFHASYSHFLGVCSRGK